MTNDNALQMTPEDHQKAFTEVAFLIESFANTIDNIMGGATAPVGRIAGRSIARKLPLNLHQPTLASVLEVLATRMQAGFQNHLCAAENGLCCELICLCTRQTLSNAAVSQCFDKKIDIGGTAATDGRHSIHQMGFHLGHTSNG